MPFKRKDFVAGGLDGSGFVDVDVSGRGGYDSFAGSEQELDDGGVGLGASGEEEDFSVWAAKSFTDEEFCAVGVRVYAVA